MFITAGIPGSVGSGAINAWIGLAHLLPRTRDFKIWPFEGTISELFASTRIIIAENYPRAIYAAALSDVPTARRPRLRLSKTLAKTRHDAINHLLSRPWVARNAATIRDTDVARADENVFDALLTAAGLLRLVVEEEPLCSPAFEDPVAEGGILGTGSINLGLPETNFAPAAGSRVGPLLDVQLYHDDGKRTVDATPGSSYRCPIPGCQKVFSGTRGGWDSHVGAFRIHPRWHPIITDHRDRLEVFRTEYPEFFG
jgi:hypothetical protein